MSLVGTRPILPDELEQYELHHRARIAIKPGIEELYHWKKCDKRKEVSRFDIFSGLMLERKEYRSLLQYRFNRGGQNFC